MGNDSFLSKKFKMFDKVFFVGKICRTDHEQKFPDLLLKNDYQCYKANRHKTSNHTTYHFHFEQLGEFPKSPNNNDPYKNIDGYSSPNEFIDIVEKYGDKNDVYNNR